MAKDDYDVIVFRVLIYLYACLKRKTTFDDIEFDVATRRKEIDESYFTKILSMMQKEGLIEGVALQKVWGGYLVMLSDFKEMEITAYGIHYIKENSTMGKVKEGLLETMDLLASLIKLVL